MCFVYKHIHFTYIRRSPSKRGFPYTVQFVHQTGGVGIRPIPNFTTLIQLGLYIEAKPRGICIKRVYPIFQDTFLSLGTCPSPVSMVRPPSSSSRCPQCVPPLTLDWSQWDWWILWTHDGPPPAYAHTSQVPHQTARMSPPQQQWRRLPHN